MKKNIYSKFTFVVLFCLVSLFSFAQQWNGLTLISVKNSYSMAVCDTNGTIVKTWTFTAAQGSNSYPAYMTQGGFIWRTVTVTSSVTPQNGGMTGRIQKIDYITGNILWDWTFNSPQGVLHHDITPMQNGNILTTAYDVRTTADIVASGSTSTLSALWSERIFEVQPVGTNSANIVWEWKMWDHLVQNVNPLKNNYQTSIVNHPELMNINHGIQTDFFHMNGLDYNPILDQISFSSHFKSEIYIIDHSTTTAQAATHTGGNSGMGGDFLYRWGNPQVYQATGTQISTLIHDGHFVPDGSPNGGYLCGFMNGGQASPLRSTIDQVKTPRSGYNYTLTLGSAFTPTNYTSRYVCTAYSSGYSNSEQYPNGNQQICLAPAGIIYEIDPLGNQIWSKNTGNLTPQAHRYTPCFITYTAPAQPVISVGAGSLVCTNAVTYQWYCNGSIVPTATTQAIVPSVTGTYVVRITDINGCAFYYSQGLYFNILTLGLSSLSTEINKIEVYPNPSTGQVNLNMNGIENFDVEVRTLSGQIIRQEKNNSTLDLSEMSNGIYFVSIHTSKGSVTKKIAILK